MAPEPTTPDATALVTGAAGGFGGALITAFQQAGYRTVGVDWAPAEGVTRLDVTDSAAVTAFAGTFDALAVLVNAAGVRRLHEDIAGPAVFLASNAARFITGTVLVVDGGYSAR